MYRLTNDVVFSEGEINETILPKGIVLEYDSFHGEKHSWYKKGNVKYLIAKENIEKIEEIEEQVDYKDLITRSTESMTRAELVDILVEYTCFLEGINDDKTINTIRRTAENLDDESLEKSVVINKDLAKLRFNRNVIEDFIKRCGYTYKVDDILESYQKYYIHGYYVSHTMGICIENLKNEIKSLLAL